MSASVYEGESRAIPRLTVLGLALLTTLVFGWMLVSGSPSERTHGTAPWLVRAPFLVHGLAFALVVAVVAALVQVARRRSLGWGGAALVGMAWLSESQTALTGDHERALFACGAVLAGWLFGVAFAHALDADGGRAHEAVRDDALGEAGAAGVIVAIYLGAFTSKLLGSGLDWGSTSNMLSTIVGRHTFNGGWSDVLLASIIAHPMSARALGLLTLAFQASAVQFLLGPRLRMLSGTMLLAFHLGAFVLMDVRYFTSMLLVLAFAYPWPRIWRRGRRATAVGVAEQATAPVVSRAVGWIVTAGGLAIAAWLLVHAEDPTRLFLELPR